MKIYLGFDGAYVLSRYPLKLFADSEQPYLATGRKWSCFDVQEHEARAILGRSKPLKMHEVVVLTVKASKPKKATMPVAKVVRR